MNNKKCATVCRQDMCTGCMACVDMCTRKAIQIDDSMKSLNAVIDEEKCVNCNICKRICQANSNKEFKKPISWYQGWAEDNIRIRGASGGVASALIESFDGIVCSCVFKNGQFIFEFDEGNRKKFAGSKYVKSDPSGIYKKIKKQIIAGDKVMFIGLPCQCAAIKNIIGDNENLFLVDLICHGTPSVKTLKIFLDEYGIDLCELDDISFRKKPFIGADEYTKVVSERIKDLYTQAFLKGLCYTENCYSCEYARLERITDITLGDSWGTELCLEEEKKGISLLLCQTVKGESLLSNANLVLKDVDLDRAIIYNKQLNSPVKKTKERDIFFDNIDKGFLFAMKKCDGRFYRKNRIKQLLIKVGIMRGNVSNSQFGLYYRHK